MSHHTSTGANQEQTRGSPEQVEYLNDLYQIASDTDLSFAEKVEQLLTVGCDYFDLTIGMLNRERKDRFEVERMVGSHSVIGEGEHTPPTDEHFCRHVVETGETACVHDAGEAGWEDDALYHEFGLECYAGVKVTVGSERYGTLSFSDRSPRDRAFTAVDRTFLELMGQCVNYELERERRVNQLTALNALSRELMDGKTADEVSDRVVEAANTTLDLPITAIALYDERGSLRPVAATDAAEEILRATALLADEGGTQPETDAGATPRRIIDPLADVDAAVGPPITELAIFPLGDHGAFVTGSTATGGFSPTDFDFVETVVANTESALDRSERERMLEGQNDRLDSFAGMLAHELRNPLNVAQIYHREAAGGDADDEVSVALNRIEEMIDVLLVTARGSDSNIDWEHVSLPEAAREAWGAVSAEAADLVVETERAVRSDPIHLHHLLENLFSNSVDHGTESVTVRVGDLEAAEGFYVADDGPGIPVEEYETVFDAGHTTDADGIGLGLTFVAQLAEAYDWECTLTESAAGGARFEFAT